MYTEHMVREAQEKAFWHDWTASSFVSRTSNLLWKHSRRSIDAFPRANCRLRNGLRANSSKAMSGLRPR
jgi:hypothetical protein